MTSARISRVWGIIFLTITISSLSLPAYAKYSGGMGEPNDPYQIATAEDIMLLGETPEDYDKHFILTADIDLDPNLPGRKVFDKAVIAADINPDYNLQGTGFTGVFDGGGHTISHLTITSESWLGLFGHLEPGAKINTLGVVGVHIIGLGRCVGGLVGGNYGDVASCYSNGRVNGRESVGGLVGHNGTRDPNRGIVTNCYSNVEVNCDYYGAGGLVGSNSGSMKYCYSTSAVSGVDSVGGVVGYRNPLWPGVVDDCFWDIETSGQPHMCGRQEDVNEDSYGKTTAEMQTAKTFLDAGWDFVGETANGMEDIWKIAEGLGYPRLSWEKYSGGTGEPNDPYQIATAEDLIALGNEPNDYDKHFILTADIDLDPNLPGGKIFDKAVIAPDTNTGIFFQGRKFTGIFNGNGFTISHLTIIGEDYSGLFGKLESSAKVENLGILGVNITGGYKVGGIAGENSGDIIRCYSTGVVRGSTSVGGLLGYALGGTLSCSFSTAAVNGSLYAGGLVGEQWGTVSNCYSTGIVTGVCEVGGLTGANSGPMINCYSTGWVSGTAWGVGGLVGTRTLGGIVADCFWDVETSGQTWSAGGTGKTTAEMHTESTFTDAGWDFVGEMQNGLHEIWQMPVGGGYPVLAILSGYIPPRLQGQGTAQDPYLIYDALELGAMVNYSPSAHYRLAASIDLLGICWRTAVIPFFGGTFDGNNLTITHLTIGSGNCVGLFGQLESGAEVKDLCVVDVNISGSDYAVGGLVGVSGGTVMQCHSTGTVSGDSHVGGLVGYNYGTVTQCYSTGVVSGIVGVGGLVGYSYDTLTHCYSTCVVDGNDIVGGLVGENWGAVTNCYSVGAVTGNTSVGGLLGNVGIDPWSPVPTATNSFWDTQTSGQATSADGTGKTTAEMQTANTFLDASWDFVGETANGTEDIWWIDEGRGYPRLWWELIPEN